MFFVHREEVDGLFPIKDLRPLDPPNAADAEAEELSAVGAALAMVSFLSRLHNHTHACPSVSSKHNLELMWPLFFLQLKDSVRKQYTDAELMEMKR